MRGNCRWKAWRELSGIRPVFVKLSARKIDLLMGTHGQMTTSSAIRLAKRLEKFDPLWLEEPTPPENSKEMARVAHATSIPVATGERLNSKYDFCTRAARWRRVYLANEPWPLWRIAGSQKNCGHGRNLLRANCATFVLRTNCCCSQYSAQHLQPEFFLFLRV